MNHYSSRRQLLSNLFKAATAHQLSSRLLDISDRSVILPNLQLWVHRFIDQIRIDEDLSRTQRIFVHDCGQGNNPLDFPGIEFDNNELFVIDIYTIKRLENNFENKFFFRDVIGNKTIPLGPDIAPGIFSVCFHQKKELEFSLIDKKLVK